MAQFAYFDSTQPAPQRVQGWYDTDEFAYATLHVAADLLAVTPAQWSARLANPAGWAVQSGALVPYVAPVVTPTPAQEAGAILAAGTVVVVSTGTPALDGIYAVDPRSQSEMQAVSLFIAVNNRFPGAGPGLGWPDVAGGIHNFGSVAAFQSFATGIADRVAEIKAVITGQSTIVPSVTVAIA